MLDFPKLNRKKLAQIPLSDSCKAVILGSLLGDGSITIGKGYKNARFQFRHSDKQKDYFDWKVSLLREISTPSACHEQASDGFGKKANPAGKKWHYQSKALESLTELHSQVYKKGRFTIRRRWLNHLTPQSLAVWWLDDGSIISNGRKGVLCTDGFDEKSVNLIARYLLKVWSINSNVKPIKRALKDGYSKEEYYRIWLNTTELKKFLQIVLPYIPYCLDQHNCCNPLKCIVHKVTLQYKDSQLQERWISEINHAAHKSALFEHIKRARTDSENDIVHSDISFT